MTHFADTLLERGVKKVVHFHTDHFEAGRKDLADEVIAAEHVDAWLKEVKDLPWARKASLMYFSRWLRPVWEADGVARFRAKGIEVLEAGDLHFAPSGLAERDEEIVRALHEAGQDIHIHIHHEHWCSGRLTGEPIDGVKDGQRVEAHIQWLLERYKRFGLDMADWCFVHGCWNLNANDVHDPLCHITNEIEILHRNGCIGDFTFPAGREWVDPVIKRPFTIKPMDAPRCYDNPASLPKLIGVDPDAMHPERFLIWSSEIPTGYCSLDNLTMPADPEPKTYLTVNGELIRGTIHERAVWLWVKQGWVHQGVLYVKTHCHSLMSDKTHPYWISSTRNRTPLAVDATKEMFGLLYDVCSEAGVEVEHITIRELLNRLREGESA